MFEFEDFFFLPPHFSQGGLGGGGASGLHFVWSGHPRAWASRSPPHRRHPDTHPARHLAAGAHWTPNPKTEGWSPHPIPSAPCPRTSGGAAAAQGRGAFLSFVLFPFYVVCGHVMEGGFWRVLFSCQPELLIRLSFFLSAFLFLLFPPTTPRVLF